MKLELKEFIEATRLLHERRDRGGVKRTRLMLRLRPHSHSKTFIIKCTDGRTTYTTSVSHQGQLKLVENLVQDFVTGCTADSVVPKPTHAEGEAPAPGSLSPPPPPAVSVPQSNPNPSGGKGGKKGKRGKR
ncbi:unnamed protein product [Phytomonas sp. EM1]|nr:unnamed protein product [Phytomonas sp. EM1]|eukprot:CCW62886.1 unnamed protein product [Phytomonas sp. isolate EM1]